MKKVVVFVNMCQGCPHEDDLGRCSLLDRSQKKTPWVSSWGILEDCPLPEASREEDLLAVAKEIVSASTVTPDLLNRLNRAVQVCEAENKE